MTDDQRRRVDSFQRIDRFAELHPEDFPAGRRATQLLGTIRAAAADAAAGGASQVTHGGAARDGTATKSDLFDELLEDLKAISRTARSIAEEEPGGFDQQFRMPRPASHGAVLSAAKSFLAAAAPVKATFLDYEMPADFLEDLAADIAAFEAADEDQDEGQILKAGATRSVAQAVAAGARAARTLDPILRNRYRNNPARLTEWLTASRVERAPRRKPAA